MSFDAIRALAANLAVGEQASGLLCPRCRGGAGGELSLSISRDAIGAKYFCHRASCGAKGAVGMSPISTYESTAKPKPREYIGDLVEVPADVRTRLSDKIDGVDFIRQGIKWAPNYAPRGRLALPIRSRFGTRIGWEFRSTEKGDGIKSRLHMTTFDAIPMSWVRWIKGAQSVNIERMGAPLILVEDQMSAYKAAHFCNAIALLGTNISDAKLNEIASAHPKMLIVALDEDATAKAASIVSKLVGVVDNIKFMPLKKDLKDMPLDEVEKTLNLRELMDS